MKKLDAVLIVLNEKMLTDALQNFNFGKMNLLSVITEKIDIDDLKIGGRNVIPAVKKILNRNPNCIWLICGNVNDDTNFVKKRLMANGVAEKDIVNFELLLQINHKYLENLHYIEKNGADFFATGGSQAVLGLDLNYIPHVKGRGVNLSKTGQTLQQGYLTAKQIFEHVKPGKIKFVLIDLSPILFPCIGETGEFDTVNIQVISDNLVGNKIPTDEQFEEILQILQDYASLCYNNGARPIFVTFPVAPTIWETYDEGILRSFNETVNKAGKNYEHLFINLLKIELADDCFYGNSYLNSIGAAATSAMLGAWLCINDVISPEKVDEMDYKYFNVLSKYCLYDYKVLIQYIFCKRTCDDYNRFVKILPKDECEDWMARVFSELTYKHLDHLSKILLKDDYNELVARIFKISVEKIRRKSKIKVGFVIRSAAEWCGDFLYNLFAEKERFEVTIFLCLSNDYELVKKDFLHGIEQFKSHGLNVIPVAEIDNTIPPHDVLIFLTPYPVAVANAFRPENLNVKTLMVYIPYGINSTQFSLFNREVICAGWKQFFNSIISLEDYDNRCRVGVPRGFYSGYSRMDIFFKEDTKFKFDWKMTSPDAKKIIWAPHWSIKIGTKYATFQWNYEFMYEFAKNHPETSWVVKPHPRLLSSAVISGVFPSDEAFEEYLQKWNDLPNAQVYTGAYYQAIFATSDGMIHDCGSFIAEYQYSHKPMIYLTRDTQKFNRLGKELLNGSYLVDGQDLNAIAAMIEKVFIKGNDFKATKREEIFDKYLNYPKANGMLASEFIYNNIAEELK